MKKDKSQLERAEEILKDFEVEDEDCKKGYSSYVGYDMMNIRQKSRKLKVGCGEYINVRLGIVCGNKNYNNPLCDDCQRIKEIKERVEK